MGLKFSCTECGAEIGVRFLQPGELALCKSCGSHQMVPSDAAVVDDASIVVRCEPAAVEKDWVGWRVRDTGWVLWGRWLLATLIGWFVGLIASIVLLYNTWNFFPEETNPIAVIAVVISGLLPGAGVGLAQMITVRQALPLTQRWVWGAAVGMGIPFIVAGGVLGTVEASGMWIVLVAVAGGALAGLIQAPTLRRHTSRAQWWVSASLVSWGIAFLITVASFQAWILAGGAVLGVVSGALLIWIIRSSPGHEAV